jgi:hypothetical protein
MSVCFPFCSLAGVDVGMGVGGGDRTVGDGVGDGVEQDFRHTGFESVCPVTAESVL